jgi:hypothetical protein
MFALSTLEVIFIYQFKCKINYELLQSTINQQWANTDWQFHEELKNVLHNFLIEKGNTAPHFIRGKYAKLLVAIAKQDWPTHYPNFFINLIEVCVCYTNLNLVSNNKCFSY